MKRLFGDKMNEYKVTLWPSGEIVTFNDEESLLTQLKKTGKKIKSSCGGHASCADCTVVIKSGEDHLSPQNFEELRLLGNVFHFTKERLSCQTKITGDVTIDISTHEKNTFTGKNERVSDVIEGQKVTKTLLKKRQIPEDDEMKSKKISQDKANKDWYRHWEKKEDFDSSSKGVKKLGGKRRVKPFNFQDSE